MKIFLVSLCIVTILLLVCSFSEAKKASKSKCKVPLKWNAKLKRCVKAAKSPAKTTPGGTTAAGGSTTAAAGSTAEGSTAATTAAPA